MYNGSGAAPETDKLKKIAFSAGNWFDRSSVMELYVDYENVGAGKSTITGKLFYGMRTAQFMAGGEAFYRINRKFFGTGDIVPAGLSLFGWFTMNRQTRTIVRLDAVDDNLNVSSTGYRELYAMVGIDYAPVAEVRLIPNVVYVKNLKKGSGTEIADNIMVRLTTSVTFR